MTDTVTAPTTALTQLLTECLVDAAGTPWKDSAIRNRAASLVKLHTHASADGAITYEQLLCADAIDAFCDGRTAHSRAAGARAIRGEVFAQTCGAGTSQLLAVCADKILAHHFDMPSSHATRQALQVLIARAKSECTRRNRATNALVPAFGTFVAAASKHAKAAVADDVTHAIRCKHTVMLLHVVACAPRERMCLYTRAADAEGFDASVMHTQEQLDALRDEYPHTADDISLSTVLFRHGQPVSLVLGLHGGDAGIRLLW
jgi:hypothetical protein